MSSRKSAYLEKQHRQAASLYHRFILKNNFVRIYSVDVLFARHFVGTWMGRMVVPLDSLFSNQLPLGRRGKVGGIECLSCGFEVVSIHYCCA